MLARYLLGCQIPHEDPRTSPPYRKRSLYPTISYCISLCIASLRSILLACVSQIIPREFV